MGESLIISDITKKFQIHQTSGYRKINFLINNGLLVSSGFEFTLDGKKVKKYETIIDNVIMEIVKNSVSVKIQLKKSLLNESSILQTVQIHS